MKAAKPSRSNVLHHLLDVAAAALVLQESAAHRLERDAIVFDVPPSALATTRAALVGLHDLGKFAASFQALVPGLWPTAILGAYRPRAHRPHWRLTARLLVEPVCEAHLVRLVPDLGDAAREALIAAVAGHHGVPTSPEDLEEPGILGFDETVGSLVPAIAAAAIEAMLARIDPEPIRGRRSLAWARRFSWSLAGLATLADWVGSDGAIFEFEDPGLPLDVYWIRAIDRAQQAVREKGLVPALPASSAGLATAFPEIAEPRPMQRTADALALPEGPALFVVEDATGSGKTEAAVALASRLVTAGRAEGLYVALPTMATADAMFARLSQAYARLFAPEATPSIVLAHGRSALSEPFAAIRRGSEAGQGGEEGVAAACSAWIADHRRKAFFAEVGAGTIDQAFLAVLAKKWLALRQYGLAGRVLIVDEAHAFDVYMAEELATLLELHAMAGGSAIVLSATLPRTKRTAIAAAFARGLGAPAPRLSENGYPLVTVVSAEGAHERAVAPYPGTERRVRVERIGEAGEAARLAIEAARRGAAVLWVRNAVEEAIAAYKRFDGAGIAADLFHARFAMIDRQAIEREVMRRFGREARTEDRAGRVLVATQVVEQSLDLDFDLVISDLAPVDLLIQRAGRLWRHMTERPAATRPVEGPRLLVLSPEPMLAESDPDWLEPVLGKGAFVYRHPGVMWRSARALFDAGEIVATGGLRPLIERVYGAEDVPEVLERAQGEARGREYGEATIAGQNTVKPCDGYGGVTNISSDQEIGTRLGEAVRTVRIARIEGERLEPWAIDADPMRAWALSEVTVRESLVRELRVPEALAPAQDRARANWPDWERERIMLAPVDEDGILMLDGAGSPRLRYDRRSGLRVERPDRS